MHSITFEHRYLLCRTFPSQPPLYLCPLAPVSICFSRYISLFLFLSPVFPRSRSNALPAGNRRPDFSLSLSLSYPLYTRPRRGLRTVTRVHFLTRMSTSKIPRARRTRRHGVYTILRPLLRVAYSGLPLFRPLSRSLSLPLVSDSLLLSILRAFARRCTRPCYAVVVFRRREERSGRRTTGELAVREIEICPRRCAVCPCSVAREPKAEPWRRRRRYGGRARLHGTSGVASLCEGRA